MRRTPCLPSSLTLKLATYPSFFRMRAISTFSFDEGMSTRGSLARTEFRIRVIMSATGSVMFMGLLLPARLDHAGDFPGQGILPEADAAHLELPEIAPRPSAVAAPRILAHGELRLALGLGNQRQLRHYLASCCVRNGMPRYWRRSRDSSSVRAVVTNVTFMPRSLSTFA